jgi:hypothetical protein
MVVFISALLSTIVVSILALNTVDIQIMQNTVNAAEALETAKAGLNDALAQLRLDDGWEDGFTDKAFSGGSYSVGVDKGEITAIAATSKGFVANVVANVTLGMSGPPYAVRVNTLEFNVKDAGI